MQTRLRSSLRLALFLPLCFATHGVHACSADSAYIGSICIMAWPKTNDFGGYMWANGRVLQVNQSQALYAVIGNTYGGTAPSTFQLPDLRSRMIVGAGQGTGLPNYPFGQSAGAASVTLTALQLPAHTHTFATAQVPLNLSTLTATTTMTGLMATTSMAGVTGSVAGSSLTLNANGGAGGVSTPGGNALATINTPNAKLYAGGTPSVAMAAGSISGTASVSFGGNPTTTLSTPTLSTSLAGSATANVSGTTAAAGSGQAFSIMPPFVAMPVYIAVNGIFPTSN